MSRGGSKGVPGQAGHFRLYDLHGQELCKSLQFLRHVQCIDLHSGDHRDGHNPSLTANIIEGECIFDSNADIPHAPHV